MSSQIGGEEDQMGCLISRFSQMGCLMFLLKMCLRGSNAYVEDHVNFVLLLKVFLPFDQGVCSLVSLDIATILKIEVSLQFTTLVHLTNLSICEEKVKRGRKLELSSLGLPQPCMELPQPQWFCGSLHSSLFLVLPSLNRLSLNKGDLFIQEV